MMFIREAKAIGTDPWNKPLMTRWLKPAPCIPIDDNESIVMHRIGIPDVGPPIVFWHDYNGTDYWMQGDYD